MYIYIYIYIYIIYITDGNENKQMMNWHHTSVAAGIVVSSERLNHVHPVCMYECS